MPETSWKTARLIFDSLFWGVCFEHPGNVLKIRTRFDRYRPAAGLMSSLAIINTVALPGLEPQFLGSPAR